MFSNSSTISDGNGSSINYDGLEIKIRPILYISEVLGLPGNILILLLASRSRRTSSLTYITFLAIFDFCTLLILLQSIFYHLYMTIYRKSYVVHGLLISTMLTCKASANWFLAFLSLERCVAVCFPFHKRTWFTMTKVYTSIIVTTLFFLLSTVFSLFSDSTIAKTLLLDSIGLICIFWLPALLMLVCTSLAGFQL